jgi:glutaredoxin
MKKILVMVALFCNLFAGDKEVSLKIYDFIKTLAKTDVIIDSYKLTNVIPVSDNWKAYVLNISINGSDVTDVFFTDGVNIAHGFYSLDDKEDMRAKILDEESLKSFDKELYDSKFLIKGDASSKNKVVIFSDPICPYCVNLLPQINSQYSKSTNVAIYYYPFPLTKIHPTAETISRAIYVLKEKGFLKSELQFYSHLKEDEKMQNRLKKEDSVLSLLNEKYNSKLTEDDLYTKEVDEHMNFSGERVEKNKIKSTPTIFVNGMLDLEQKKIFNLKD